MADPQDFEALFLKHLAWIEKVAAMACGRAGVWGADAEDFSGWVKVKLMENDYAALRKFRGDAEFRTYLATVVVRQFHEYGRERRGRWRPSAAAERLGSPARELEALLYRDGYRLEQAGEMLRTSGRTTLSDAELARLIARVPARAPLRPVEVDAETALFSAEGASRADERIARAEAEEQRGRLMGALGRAMERLDPQEQVIVRMHFADGYGVADVARALGIEQKPLYRTVEKLRKQLRKYLEADGVGEGDVRGTPWEGDGP